MAVHDARVHLRAHRTHRRARGELLLELEAQRELRIRTRLLDRRVDLYAVLDVGRRSLLDEELPHLLLATLERVGDA
jgi:hypothetical protein